MDDHEPITCHSPMMPVLPALPEGAGQGLGGSGGIGSGAISRRSPPPPPQQLGRSPFLGRSGRGLGMGSAGGLIGGASQDGLRGAGSSTGSPPPSAPVNATWGKGPSPGAPFSPSAHIGSRSPPSASAFPPAHWVLSHILGSTQSSVSTPHASIASKPTDSLRHTPSTARRPPGYKCPQCPLLAGVVFKAKSRTIERILPLSAAHLQGMLREGDEIVEVNGRACDPNTVRKALECSGNVLGHSVVVTVVRWTDASEGARFSGRLLLAPAHEVLAKEKLWLALQELSSPVPADAVDFKAGIGLILGLKADGDVYVESLVDQSPAMLSGMIQRLDIVHSIDGMVVKGKLVDEISSCLVGEEDTVCLVKLLRSESRETVQVSLKRALPAGMTRRPTVRDVAAFLDKLERKRLELANDFVENFSSWHSAVHEWLHSSVRAMKDLSQSPTPRTPGKLNVSASRGGPLVQAIRVESQCEQMTLTLQRRTMLVVLEFWGAWSWRRRRMGILGQKVVARGVRVCARVFFAHFLHHAIAKRLYRRQLAKAIVYGRLVHSKFGFAALAEHRLLMREQQHEAKINAFVSSSVKACMQRTRLTRLWLAWRGTYTQRKVILRAERITSRRSVRRSLLRSLWTWIHVVRVTAQNRRKGIRLMIRTHLNRMKGGFYALSSNCLSRRQRGGDLQDLRASGLGEDAAFVERIRAKVVGQPVISDWSSISGTSKSKEIQGTSTRSRALHAWLCKLHMKEQTRTCRFAFTHWCTRRALSIRRFVQFCRFQGRRGVHFAASVLRRWLWHARYSQKLRRNCVKVLLRRQHATYTKSFETWDCEGMQSRRLRALQIKLEKVLDRPVNAEDVLGDVFDSPSAHYPTHRQVGTAKNEAGTHVATQSVPSVPGSKDRRIEEGGDGAAEEDQQRMSVQVLQSELDLCKSDLAHCKADLEAVRRLHLTISSSRSPSVSPPPQGVADSPAEPAKDAADAPEAMPVNGRLHGLQMLSRFGRSLLEPIQAESVAAATTSYSPDKAQRGAQEHMQTSVTEMDRAPDDVQRGLAQVPHTKSVTKEELRWEGEREAEIEEAIKRLEEAAVRLRTAEHKALPSSAPLHISSAPHQSTPPRAPAIASASPVPSVHDWPAGKAAVNGGTRSPYTSPYASPQKAPKYELVPSTSPLIGVAQRGGAGQRMQGVVVGPGAVTAPPADLLVWGSPPRHYF